MNSERIENLDNALMAYLNNSDQFMESFLNSLTKVELEAFFYIDIHRADTFIRELSSMGGDSIGIDDLNDPENLKNIPEGHLKFLSSISNLIQLWNTFGVLPAPDLDVRQSIVNKHNEFIRELSDLEIDFFLNC
jgi:hypothetical protein